MYSSEVQVTRATLFETPEELSARVFRELKPRTAAPVVRVEFCRFANANSFVRWDESGLGVRITDVLEGAPAPIIEALAQILLSKLLRRPTPRGDAERYPPYLKPNA